MIFLEKLKEHADCKIFDNGRSYASPCLFGKHSNQYEYGSESIIEKAAKKICTECNISNKKVKKLCSQIYYSSNSSKSKQDLDTVLDDIYKHFTDDQYSGDDEDDEDDDEGEDREDREDREGQIVNRELFIASLRKHLFSFFDSHIKKKSLFEGQVLSQEDYYEEKSLELDADGRDEAAESYSIIWSS
jgi:hypothetical protein